MVSLATGATRTWLARSPVLMPTFVVNWPGTGHQVFFSYDGRYRLLDVAGPGGSLLANSRPIASPVIVHGWASDSPMLTPDGKAVIWSQTGGRDFGSADRIAEFSAHTGRLLRVLYTVTSHVSSTGVLQGCFLDSLAPTGLHLLIECIHFGRLDGSHFTALAGDPPAGHQSVPAAW